jgi:hypothetical protein
VAAATVFGGITGCVGAVEPLVRARHLQEWLVHVASEEEPYRTRFFDALPAETRRIIESAGRVEWLPAALHVRLAELVSEAFGPVHAHAYFRRGFALSLRGPVLGSLLRTAVRVVGLTPASLLRWAPHGWKASFRNCGELTGEVLEPGHGHLMYSGLPDLCIASDPWLDSAQGSAYGALDAMGASGVVRIDKSDRAKGRMVLDIEWSDRSDRAPKE